MTRDTTTTTTSTGYPLSDAPISRPTPPRGLGGDHAGRWGASGPVLGRDMMMIKMLGSVLELIKNSKYYSLYWTRENVS